MTGVGSQVGSLTIVAVRAVEPWKLGDAARL